MKISAIISTAAVVAATLLASCSISSGWKVDGTIANAGDNSKLALEAFNGSQWYLLDSLSTNAKGAFEYKSDAPAEYPEIMRLGYPGKGNIYFPVSGKENIHLLANAEAFTSDYRLTGSDAAVRLCTVDSLINATVARLGAAAAVNDSDLRRELVQYITADTTGIVGFYSINKTIDGKHIFDAKESFGNRVYGAVAQVYSTYRPEDPRCAAVLRAYLDGRVALGKYVPEQEEQIIEAEETGLIDIVRYDYRGEKHSLAELAKEGKVILLSFTAYDIESSPAYNVILSDIYSKYHNRGLEIYQLAFDENEVSWKTAAANLPWVTVWNSVTEGVGPMVSYNVGALPMTFIINRKGEIVARVVNPNDLAKQVAKYI